MKKLLFSWMALAALALCGCHSADIMPVKGKNVPYTVAEGYYWAKATSSKGLQGCLQSEEDLYAYFAEVPGAQATKIDFSKNFAIVVVLPEKKYETSVNIVRIIDTGKSLEYFYKVYQKGDRMLPDPMQPCQLVVVDKKYKRDSFVGREADNR